MAETSKSSKVKVITASVTAATALVVAVAGLLEVLPLQLIGLSSSKPIPKVVGYRQQTIRLSESEIAHFAGLGFSARPSKTRGNYSVDITFNDTVIESVDINGDEPVHATIEGCPYFQIDDISSVTGTLSSPKSIKSHIDVEFSVQTTCQF